MIVAGLGCRKQCDVVDVLAALDLALQRVGAQRSEVDALFTADFKGHEPALQQLATQLAKPLQSLSLEQLRAQEPHLHSPSAQVRQQVGVSSVSESAALAGARTLSAQPARLPHARSIVGGATCALAMVEETT